jgi:hypothetical protein
MGLKIPSSLRRFYEEIGYGAITRIDHSLEPDCEILKPSELADLFTCDHKDWIAHPLDNMHRRFFYNEPEHEYWDLLAEGELPVLRLGWRFYHVCRPLSDKPNAVYEDHDGDLLFEDFADLMRILRDQPNYLLAWADDM